MIFLEAFADVPDPRDYTARHDLTEILFVALAAMLCGAKTCTEMAFFAKTRLSLLRQIISLEHGPPSHDTFSRVLRALDPEAFGQAFQRFMTTFGQQARPAGGRQLAVDGKSLRRAYDHGKAHMPPLVVSVLDCDTFMSLAQGVAAEGGEAACAINALKLLSLKGCTVTADALHCHRRMTVAIRQAGGDYVLTLKANQSALAKQAKAALDAAALDATLDATLGPKLVVAQTEDRAHGRHEIRRAFVIPFAQPDGKNALQDLKALARIEVSRTLDGKTSHEVRAYVLSRKIPPHDLLRIVRNHWAIENRLHWQLDVHMAEDQSRSRKDNGPANLALLRRFTLNVLRNDPEKIPLRHKQLKASWANDDLILAMTHMR